jgi:hypothetical protein
MNATAAPASMSIVSQEYGRTRVASPQGPRELLPRQVVLRGYSTWRRPLRVYVHILIPVSRSGALLPFGTHCIMRLFVLSANFAVNHYNNLPTWLCHSVHLETLSTNINVLHYRFRSTASRLP